MSKLLRISALSLLIAFVGCGFAKSTKEGFAAASGGYGVVVNVEEDRVSSIFLRFPDDVDADGTYLIFSGDSAKGNPSIRIYREETAY